MSILNQTFYNRFFLHETPIIRVVLYLVVLIMCSMLFSGTVSAANGGGGGGGSCRNNNDCNGDKICKRGKCENKPNPGGGGNNPLPNTYTESGVDYGTSDSSDPSPARTSDTEDCKVGNDAYGGVNTELGICIPKDPLAFAASFYKVGLAIIGGLSVLFIIFGGYIMLTSQGRAERLNNGKTFIFYALFGLLLAVFGYVFIEVIAIDILHIDGFKR